MVVVAGGEFRWLEFHLSALRVRVQVGAKVTSPHLLLALMSHGLMLMMTHDEEEAHHTGLHALSLCRALALARMVLLQLRPLLIMTHHDQQRTNAASSGNS